MIDSSKFPIPPQLSLPVHPYTVGGYTFGERVRSRIILWSRHLGEDIIVDPGEPVTSIGTGQVVWSEVRAGRADHPNWGGIVVVGHRHKEDQTPFYALYGHMGGLAVQVDDVVQAGQRLGMVAAGHTPENGWWKTPHLHFGIYTGPWTDTILPGYAKPFENRTKVKWWQAPQEFIKQYNSEAAHVK